MILEEARRLDAADPLRAYRDRFELPDGVVYLDGNSLGALPKATIEASRDIVTQQWGERLIRSWSEGWMEAPARIGGKIAALIGAAPHEVIATDSTSANLFKLIVAALRARPGRTTILSEAGNFPTDLHIAEGAAACVPGARLKAVPRGELAGSLDDDTALVLLTHVHYTSGERYDMADWTAKAHAAGALICWDLSHSTGAIALDLDGARADCAIGCGYKYLNGGPGAPAFLFLAERHQHDWGNPVSGWMGHAEPFAMEDGYRPGAGMERWRAGTPVMLGMAALESGLDLWEGIDMAAIEAKSAALFDILASAGDEAGLECIVPRAPAERGSHIAFRHPAAQTIIERMIERGVIGDFREPDIARFGLTPLYLSHEDVARAGTILVETVRSLG